MLSLIEMSLYGGVLTLVVMAVRLAANRLPKATLRLLWAVVLGRLLLPLRIPSPASIYTAADRLGRAAGHPGLLLDGTRAAAQTTEAVSPVLLIWGAGAVVLALLFLACHLRGRRSYRESLPAEHPYIRQWQAGHRLRRPVQVRVSDQIGSPLTYGILWPVILLPKSLDWDDTQGLAFVLAHETAHIRRFDALGKWLLAAALCLHWFNPLVWAMYLLANRDLELACDEAVVREYGRQSRASYAMTLVGMEERRSAFAPLESGFSKNALKVRITSILHSRQATLLNVCAALAVVVLVAVVFATSSPNGTEPYAATEVVKGVTAVQGTAVHTWDGGLGVLEDGLAQAFGSDSAEEQAGQLMEALFTEDYAGLSIAEFNRRVYAELNDDESGGMMPLYELVLSTLPESDSRASFLRNTVNASLTEYLARLTEAYSGERSDPEFTAVASASQRKKVFGQTVESTLRADYSFTYRILDQDGLTVGERDSFLQSVMGAAQDCLEEQAVQEGGEEAFREALERTAAGISNGKIEFTGCRVDHVELSGGDAF